jgi:N-acetylneuraminic acid mutarotase
MKKIYFFIPLVLITLCFFSCKKEKNKPPTVITNTVSDITGTSATCGGNISDDGGKSVLFRGVCWGTSPNPTIDNPKTLDGTGTGSFTSHITGLSENIMYYVRAYATNSNGTGYGNQISFLATGGGGGGGGETGLPVLTTLSATDITATSATLGGNITDAGDPAYTERGICYATFENPTTSNNKVTISGSGTGNYSTNVTELIQNTTYYVRAYAINAKGTAYGNQISFKAENGGGGGSGTWTRKANFPDGGRFCAFGFSIGNKGYIGGGQGSYSYDKSDFWEFDPVLNTWTQKASLEKTSYGAVGFSIGNKGYFGCGYGGLEYGADFFEYDPSSNKWTRKADFAGGARHAPVGFAIGNKGYIGTGYGSDYCQDFWEYDPVSNKWTQKAANFAGGGRSQAVGFSIGNKGYIGFGLQQDSHFEDFWEYNPTSNSWTQKANFQSKRCSAVGFSIGNKGYVGTGVDSENFQDFWEFDPASNEWTQKADFVGGKRSDAIGFAIGNKGYVGLGFSQGSDFWEFTP